MLGSPATIRAGIEQAAEEYGVDEVLLRTTTYEHQARRRSYELIAEKGGRAGSRGTVAPLP